MKKDIFHIIVEQDNGLFSLIHQVITHLVWAQYEGRIPIVYFHNNCCYWHPNGYQNKDTVWEYYFEPLLHQFPASSIPNDIKYAIKSNFPTNPFQLGYFINGIYWISNNFGEHSALKGKAIHLKHIARDPDHKLRKKISLIIDKYIQPRDYIQQKVEAFFSKYLKDNYVIGVHIRGTDTQSKNEPRVHRKIAYNLEWYISKIKFLIAKKPEAKIFVATDDESTLKLIQKEFGDRVIACESLRHNHGEIEGRGPLNRLMPGYIANHPENGARNGEEAIIEYLLLAKCQYFVHNGSSLARTVLFKNPDLEHINSLKSKLWLVWFINQLKNLYDILRRMIPKFLRKKIKYFYKTKILRNREKQDIV